LPLLYLPLLFLPLLYSQLLYLPLLDQVTACFDVVSDGYKRYMHSVKTLDLQEKLQDVGFMEIKMRNAGR
jgi:hypothetical protein